MSWLILLVVLVIGGLVSLSGRKQVPWADKLYRINAGVQSKGEWLAPDDIQNDVRADYLAAMGWLQDSLLADLSYQWTSAPNMLSGTFLQRHQEILTHYKKQKAPRYTGILRCTHRVEVRHFSEDGERCLVVDHQTTRRIATYDLLHHVRVITQDMGDGTVVYEMAYDKALKRWKIDAFVQELPAGWASTKSHDQIELLSVLPPANGRDS
ncbi:MAG: hypothetical protein RLP44_06830 [Aggregatilineales bacterium]